MKNFIITIIVALTISANATNPKKERIVSIYSGFTEIVTELGAKDQIVACTKVYAKELGIPSVGNHMHPSIEAIIAAKPTIVISYAKDANRYYKLSEYLKKLNIKYMPFYPATIKETKAMILKLGSLLHKEDEAKQRVSSIENKISLTKKYLKENKTSSPIRVFFEVRQSPMLLTCGNHSITADIIRTAGGYPLTINDKTVGVINIEKVLTFQPDFYIQQIGAMNRRPIPPNKMHFISKLECIKQGKFITIDEKRISRPSLSIGDTIYDLAQKLYTQNKN
jgi:ABC-type Fe3+-hydroxamate transport system substrate-binding protein